MEIKHLSLILNIPLLLIGFFLLNRGAGLFVDGSASIARKFKVPESMISFMVVGGGTSLPKLFTVLLAAYNGYFDLVMGAVLGSCIFNLLGVLSITGFSRPIRVHKSTASIGLSGVIVSAMLLWWFGNHSLPFTPATDLTITKPEGIVLLIVFVAFIVYGYFNVKRHHASWLQEGDTSSYAWWFSIVLLIGGVLGLVAGGVLVVDNLIDISRKFDLSQRFLGQFLLAFGGSFVMLYWLRITKANRAKFEVSNLTGQNMLNILFMIGVSAFIQPMPYNTLFNTDIFILIGVTLLIMGLLWMGRKLTLNLRKCRFLFLLLMLYVVYLFLRELYF